MLHHVNGALGFNARKSHERVAVQNCPALTEPLAELPGRLAAALGAPVLKELEEARLLEAKESLAFALTDPSYVFLLNDDLNRATQTLQEIAKGHVDAGLSAHGRSMANKIYEYIQKVIK